MKGGLTSILVVCLLLGFLVHDIGADSGNSTNHPCGILAPPRDGHVTCDVVTGLVCVPMCDGTQTFGVPVADAYICDASSGIWRSQPPGFGIPFPDCDSYLRRNLESSMTTEYPTPNKKSQENASKSYPFSEPPPVQLSEFTPVTKAAERQPRGPQQVSSRKARLYELKPVVYLGSARISQTYRSGTQRAESHSGSSPTSGTKESVLAMETGGKIAPARVESSQSASIEMAEQPVADPAQHPHSKSGREQNKEDSEAVMYVMSILRQENTAYSRLQELRSDIKTLILQGRLDELRQTLEKNLPLLYRYYQAKLYFDKRSYNTMDRENFVQGLIGSIMNNIVGRRALGRNSIHTQSDILPKPIVKEHNQEETKIKSLDSSSKVSQNSNLQGTKKSTESSDDLLASTRDPSRQSGSSFPIGQLHSETKMGNNVSKTKGIFVNRRISTVVGQFNHSDNSFAFNITGKPAENNTSDTNKSAVFSQFSRFSAMNFFGNGEETLTKGKLHTEYDVHLANSGENDQNITRPSSFGSALDRIMKNMHAERLIDTTKFYEKYKGNFELGLTPDPAIGLDLSHKRTEDFPRANDVKPIEDHHQSSKNVIDFSVDSKTSFAAKQHTVWSNQRGSLGSSEGSEAIYVLQREKVYDNSNPDKKSEEKADEDAKLKDDKKNYVTIKLTSPSDHVQTKGPAVAGAVSFYDNTSPVTSLNTVEAVTKSSTYDGNSKPSSGLDNGYYLSSGSVSDTPLGSQFESPVGSVGRNEAVRAEIAPKYSKVQPPSTLHESQLKIQAYGDNTDNSDCLHSDNKALHKVPSTNHGNSVPPAVGQFSSQREASSSTPGLVDFQILNPTRQYHLSTNVDNQWNDSRPLRRRTDLSISRTINSTPGKMKNVERPSSSRLFDVTTLKLSSTPNNEAADVISVENYPPTNMEKSPAPVLSHQPENPNTFQTVSIENGAKSVGLEATTRAVSQNHHQLFLQRFPTVSMPMGPASPTFIKNQQSVPAASNHNAKVNVMDNIELARLKNPSPTLTTNFASPTPHYDGIATDATAAALSASMAGLNTVQGRAELPMGNTFSPDLVRTGLSPTSGPDQRLDQTVSATLSEGSRLNWARNRFQNTQGSPSTSTGKFLPSIPPSESRMVAIDASGASVRNVTDRAAVSEQLNAGYSPKNTMAPISASSTSTAMTSLPVGNTPAVSMKHVLLSGEYDRSQFRKKYSASPLKPKSASQALVVSAQTPRESSKGTTIQSSHGTWTRRDPKAAATHQPKAKLAEVLNDEVEVKRRLLDLLRVHKKSLQSALSVARRKSSLLLQEGERRSGVLPLERKGILSLISAKNLIRTHSVEDKVKFLNILKRCGAGARDPNMCAKMVCRSFPDLCDDHSRNEDTTSSEDYDETSVEKTTQTVKETAENVPVEDLNDENETTSESRSNEARNYVNETGYSTLK